MWLMLVVPSAWACEPEPRLGDRDAITARAILIATVNEAYLDATQTGRGAPVIFLKTEEVLKGNARATFEHVVRCNDSFIFKPGDRAILVTDTEGATRLTDPRHYPDYEREIRSSLRRMRVPGGSVEVGVVKTP